MIIIFLIQGIQLELITTWREYINENKKEIFKEQDITSPPSQIGKGWIEENINLNTTDNYYDCQISPPKGSYKFRRGG